VRLLPVEYSQNSTDDRAVSQAGNVVRVNLFWRRTDCKHIHTHNWQLRYFALAGAKPTMTWNGQSAA